MGYLWVGMLMRGYTVRVLLLLGTALVISHVSVADDEYLIIGNIPALVEEGEVVLSRSTATLGASQELAREPISGGQFRLVGTGIPGRVSLRVYDTEENFKGTLQFILEPGEIRVEYPGSIVGLIVQGGPLNQQVIAVWQDSKEYRKVLADYNAVMASRRDTEADEELIEQRKAESIRLYNKRNGMRRDVLRQVALSEDDPHASMFAIEMGGLSRQEALDRLKELEPLIGEHATLSALRGRLNTGVQMADTSDRVQVGSKVKKFRVQGLDRKNYEFTDALAANKYVLVEFWASWCGPCRVDNPHLKEVYAKYQPHGFEIFGFSLDDNLEDWAEASEEDGIPWINTSDLKTYGSPVPALFGVLAIPKNFLVDSEGKIVEINLRKEELDKKLVELFGA